MPSFSEDHATRRDSRALIRSNAWGPGLAAAMMLYFAYSGGRFQIPDGTGPLEIGKRIFIHTLEIGGWAMLLATLSLLTGLVWALLFDAVCSVAIGVLFCIAAGLMTYGGGGGFVCSLYGVFGLLFIMSGARSGRDWTRLRGSIRIGMGGSKDDVTDAPAPSASLASQLSEGRLRREDAQRPVRDAPREAQPIGEPGADASAVVTDPPRAPQDDVIPTEGFLASFAPEDDRKDREHD